MKRLLVFLVLLGCGIGVLWLATGGEVAVNAGSGGSREMTEPAQPRAPSGVSVQQGKMGMKVSQTGPVSFPQYKTVPQPDGSARYERVFVLDAEDSQPLAESLQQLDRATVLVFENDRAVAKLTAQRAFLELNRDASGKPSLREDKEIDLRDAVFETLPGARLEGLRLEVGNARIRVGEEELQLRTATDDEPVLLSLQGARDATLRGKGLQARLPRSKTSTLRRADVSILHEPVLETQGVMVRAQGQMDYREDLDTGAAIVTLDDRTELQMVRPGRLRANGESETTHVRGDRFTGWLLRNKRGPGADPTARGDAVWSKLLLTGAPATVELPEGVLQTPRISVLPGPFGDPWIVTAHGGASRFEQRRPLPGSKLPDLLTGTSPRRIHLVRPGNGTGTALRSFGFPQWSLQSLDRTHVAVFEGESRIVGGRRTITASRGLHVFHRDGADAVAARGFGDVHVEQRAGKPGEHDLLASGNDGFLMFATESAQQLDLGPQLPDDLADGDAPWRRHRYQVRYGPAALTGAGACRIDRDGEHTRLVLRAPGSEITGRFGERELALDNVRQLTAELDGEAVTSLDVAGLPARCRHLAAGDSVVAVAPRLQQIGVRSLRMTGVPADAPPGLWPTLAEQNALPILTRTITAGPHRRGGKAQVRGPLIDLHHFGGEDVFVEAVAVAGLQPAVDLVLDGEAGGEPTTAWFHAERLRALPFVLTPSMRRLHAGGTATAIDGLVFGTVTQPWLLVDEVRDFQLEDPTYGLIEGSGTQLVLSQGAQAAMFVGDPDRGIPATVRNTQRDRTMAATGARVRIWREQDLRLQALRTFENRPTFLPPSVTLHSAGSTALLSHMNAVCQGNIDVLTERVLFGGPVRATGLTDTGDVDPDGIQIDARDLTLHRDPTTGTVVRALAGGVHVDWTRLQAWSESIELDVKRTRCIARDPNGARVELPSGLVYRSPHIVVDYETMAVSSRNGRIEQSVGTEAPQR